MGLRGDRLYGIWCNMRSRCTNPNVGCYPRYGGRGISICEEWSHWPTFKAWAEASGYAPDLTIDRIDNDGHYEPGNCRWLDNKAQALNRRTTYFLPDGRPAVEVARENGINVFSFCARVKKLGWSIEDACTRPLRPY